MKLYRSLCGVMLSLTSAAYAAPCVSYPNIDGLGAQAIGYQVLELALKKTNASACVKVTDQVVNQERARDMVSKGELDVVDTGVQKDLESQFDGIYRPMDRGILGWRLFIINKDNEAALAKVKHIEDLRQYTAGQGNGWGDIVILEAAGLKVKTAPQISNLIQMVGGKRFDFFPLGANEVYGFLDKYGEGNKSLMVEKNVVLVYPYGRFFFVKKGNTALKQAIEKGMDAILDDGSLQRLLETHAMFSDAFKKANLKGRTVIRIDSPGLPDAFAKIDKKWWYDPTK